MPDWTAPFHTPKMETDEFAKQKAKYVAEKGYTITVPSLEDIIHIGTVEPMSDFEKDAWKRKEFNKLSDERVAELRKDKQKKRDRYKAMLSSPTPSILKNAGAILTSLDDCQDALTTLSVVGKLAIHFAPRIIGKALLGPIGWIMTAADCINLVMTLGRLFTAPMMGKRAGDLATGDNPFSKKASVKRAARLSKPFPTKGNLIEVAQTTDQIFGVGLCLGPIVGFVEDVVTGGIRSALGQPVSVNYAPPHTSPALYPASRVPKAALLVLASGYQPDDETLNQVMVANYLAQQELASNSEGWNALDAVQDINKCQVASPTTKNLLSQEVLEEEGAGPEYFGGWPHSNKPWAPITDIMDELASPAKSSLRSMMEYHAHDWNGFLLGSLATGSHFYTMGSLEGEDQVRYDYTVQSKFKTIILGAGLYPDPVTPKSKLDLLARCIEDYEQSGHRLSLITILDVCDSLEIKLLKMG